MTEEITPHRLLAFARRLQRVSTYAELLEATREEVIRATAYRHVWLTVVDETGEELHLVEFAGDQRDLVWEHSRVVKVTASQYLEDLVKSEEPVVVHDARIHPDTNKENVARLQSRTIIHVPLRMLEKPLGLFGIGTFGDEGCRSPTDEELEYLVGMGGQLTVAAARIRFTEAKARGEREKRDHELRMMMQMQKFESLGLLAGGIAHDFNNLLTVIVSGVSLAFELTTDSEAAAELETVLEAAGRAGQLTKQLLIMSRSQDLDLRSVDVNARLEQILVLLSRVMPQNIELDLIRAAKLPPVHADATQLDQIFMNLCVNSRDAMPDGGRITIESEQILVNGGYAAAHPWAKVGRYVLITVTDTGPGMPPEVAERVFEPFFTTKGPRAGSGLGLAVAYGIVRQHGGMMHCQSEVGVGTSFKVYLPAIEQLAGAVGSKLRSVAPTGTERILLAEDDASVRAVAVKVLLRAGYDVTAVANGDAACHAAAKHDFGLVILDVVMPGMPCTEVVARLEELRPGIRILLASGYPGGKMDKGNGTEPLEVLLKPYDPDRLLRGVRSLIDRGRL